jgi:hypothetical protein
VVTLYCFLFVCGVLSMTRSLSFGLMLGVSRRAYYLGTALLVLVLGVVYGLGLTALQAIERATGGWGLGVNFFRVPWILDGPWYETWLTAFVLLVLFFLYGMWYGLVYRRWSLPGLAAFPRRPGTGRAGSCRRGDADRQLERVWQLLRHHADAAIAAGRAGGGRCAARAGRVHHPAPGRHLIAGWPPARRLRVTGWPLGQLSKLGLWHTSVGAADGDSR